MHGMGVVHAPMPLYALGQRIVRHERVRPDGTGEILFADQPTVSLDEEHEHSERLTSELHFLPAAEQAPSVQIEHDLAVE